MVQPMNAGPCAFWTKRVESNAAARRRVVTEIIDRQERRVARVVSAAASRIPGRRTVRYTVHYGVIFRQLALILSVIVVLWAAGVAGVRVWGALLGGTGSAMPVTLAVSVRPGDSWWSLARRYGDPREYVLDRVDRIARANHLPATTALVPGQKVLVPVTNPALIATMRQRVVKVKGSEAAPAP